ncbi:hypothetical protein RRG08_017333 [Elysia crispata]|uniref:TNFR-Cys domain-containing protein n=1 Tax=Elysia crispata TaxID=231223 RepID=A0AAE1CKK6_9GAST|nr:hypothetical protein RRG08_017333 [Elysia crispata]
MMRYSIQTVLLGVFFLCVSNVCSIWVVVCGPGKRLVAGRFGQRDTCEMCSDGYFQDKKVHREVFCYRCTKFDAYTSVQKILEDDCTRFHDVKYRCKKGFHLNEHKDCVACPLGKVVKDGKCVDPSVDFQEPGESLEPKQKDGILERRPNGCETHHDNGTYNQTKGDNASLDDADMQMSIGMFIGIIFAVLTIQSTLLINSQYLIIRSEFIGINFMWITYESPLYRESHRNLYHNIASATRV